MDLSKVGKLKFIEDVPVVTIKQNKTKLDFIIDTGASHSFITDSLTEELVYKPAKSHYRVYGFDAISNESNTIFIDFKINKYQFKNHLFQVMKIPGIERLNKKYNTSIRGLLGSDFLRQYGFLIDLKGNFLYKEA